MLWWEGCPSTGRAHELLREALAAEGLDPDSVELVEIETEADAQRERFVGSPTIRVGGVEVAPEESEPMGLSCRIYRLPDGRTSPTPNPGDIREAIRKATS